MPLSTKTGWLAACAAIALCATGTAQAATDRTIDLIAAPHGAKLSTVADNTSFSIVLALPLRDQAAAQAYANAVSDPRNPLYGHYLTPQEFGTRFGADTATYEYLRSWAAKLGFTVGERTDSRTIISIEGTARQFEDLFATKLVRYMTPHNGEGQAVLKTPVLPFALAGRVAGIVGLTYAEHFAPLLQLPDVKPSVGTGKGGGYAPSDIRTAYDIPSQTSSAKTETLALFEQGGDSASNLTTFETQYNLPAVPVTQIGVNGAGVGVVDGVKGEVQLDLDVAVGLDPQLAGIRIYIDGKDSFQTALLDALNQIGQDDIAKVVSISYGQSESAQGNAAIQAENTALIQLKSEGITVFASSGDSGADKLKVSDPASQPNITAVGGTTLNTVAGTQKWSSETAWNSSGGGVSSVWAIPSFQVINGVSVAVANGGSSTMRNVPDVAADANPNTGYSVYCTGYVACGGFSGWVPVGGTSLASPIWASMISIKNADLTASGKPRVGYFNPTVYPQGVTGVAFHDIVSGNNGSPGYTAGPGYDDVTGFGSIDLGKYLADYP